VNLYDLTMPLDWESMPDEVFPTSTHFLLAPRRHPAKGLTMGNETGTCLMLPSQFEELRKTTRVHKLALEQLFLRDTVVVTVASEPGQAIVPADLQAALATSDISAGDALLVRTGWGDRVDDMRGTDRYMRQSPYFTEEAATVLASTMDEHRTELLLTDTAVFGMPTRHLSPQWADMLPRPAPWPSTEAYAYLRSYTAERVAEDWAADLVLARAGKVVVRKLVNCGALPEGRLKVIVAPLHLVRGIGATCRVIAIQEEAGVAS
jgi:kynurenine formamidase